MELDDELCLCFHVTKRKVVNYIRVERPRAVSQLSGCFGAGTGCGWCRTYMEQLFQRAACREDAEGEEPSARQYARGRGAYVRAGHGTPPAGATPID